MALVVYILLLFSFSSALSVKSRTISPPASDQTLMTYHNGPLLKGPTAVNLIWYGNFTPTQRSIIVDFISSLSSTTPGRRPSVSTWWATTQKLYHAKVDPASSGRPLSLSLNSQVLDQHCSLGKSLRIKNIARFAAVRAVPNSITVFLTAADVTVDGFCRSRCGTHGSSRWGMPKGRFTFIWVGNSAAQCPGYCAWPFYQPVYGPQSPPLVAPNNDVGVDGMIINLATLLAGTVTNPFGDGFYQGPAEAPLEAASACTGVYGKGAYPGYPGELLVEAATGASYNVEGVKSRKYLLPALFDPSTSQCSPPV